MGQRAALYLRVSKTDGSQSTDNQRPDVERLIAARGLTVAHVYEEQGSAVKHRPMYEQMIRDAKRGKFAVLGVWAIDRLGRSLVGNLQDILELDRIGVQIVSVRETWLDTSGPVRSLLIAVFSWAAEQERARLVERTKAGLERARRLGRLGRPKRHVARANALASGARAREENASEAAGPPRSDPVRAGTSGNADATTRPPTEAGFSPAFLLTKRVG